MVKLQLQPQMITTVTKKQCRCSVFRCAPQSHLNMFLVVVQYKQKAALLLQLFAVKAIDPCLAMQIPKRLYTLEELRLNNLRPEEFLSPEDSTLNTVRTILQVMCATITCSASLLCNQSSCTAAFRPSVVLKAAKCTASNSAVQLMLVLAGWRASWRDSCLFCLPLDSQSSSGISGGSHVCCGGRPGVSIAY